MSNNGTSGATGTTVTSGLRYLVSGLLDTAPSGATVQVMETNQDVGWDSSLDISGPHGTSDGVIDYWDLAAITAETASTFSDDPALDAKFNAIKALVDKYGSVSEGNPDDDVTLGTFAVSSVSVATGGNTLTNFAYSVIDVPNVTLAPGYHLYLKILDGNGNVSTSKFYISAASASADLENYRFDNTGCVTLVSNETTAPTGALADAMRAEWREGALPDLISMGDGSTNTFDWTPNLYLVDGTTGVIKRQLYAGADYSFTADNNTIVFTHLASGYKVEMKTSDGFSELVATGDGSTLSFVWTPQICVDGKLQTEGTHKDYTITTDPNDSTKIQIIFNPKTATPAKNSRIEIESSEFAAMDKNGDGIIELVPYITTDDTSGQLMSLVTSLGIRLSEWTNTTDQSKAASLAADGIRLLQGTSTDDNYADRDNNGYIDQTDINMLTSSTATAAEKTLAAKILSILDTNHSGKIDDGTNGTKDERLFVGDYYADRNGDGYIDQADVDMLTSSPVCTSSFQY